MEQKRHVYTDVIMAGFGGQGLMFIGKLLAYCAMKHGLNVTWIPSYGPEMRGGTANCTVVISDDPIGSPVISAPEALIIMNNPSLEVFEPKLKGGGLLLVDSTLVTRKTKRKDIKVVAVPADDIAIKIGEKRAANMVMLGAYAARVRMISEKDIVEGFKALFEGKAQYLDANIKALEKGMNYSQS
jgi:2-oxoglutarate ferredoxin oxidoreductase subunit gamma